MKFNELFTKSIKKRFPELNRPYFTIFLQLNGLFSVFFLGHLMPQKGVSSVFCNQLWQDVPPQTHTANRSCISATFTHHSEGDIERRGNQKTGWAAGLHVASLQHKDVPANN